MALTPPWVKDYGRLMPTMIYNCAFMESICNDIGNFLAGGLPVLGKESVFHYDYSKDGTTNKTSEVRRTALCPQGWIRGGRCPEDDRPSWFACDRNNKRRIGNISAVLSGV